MDKKNISKRVAAILLSGVTLISSTGFTIREDKPTYEMVALMSNQEKIKIYTGINLFLDDRVFVPTDVNGNIVEPFVVNGTTYLPIRALAEALNLNVNWNDAERIVELTSNQTGEKKNDTPYRPNTSLTEKKVAVTKDIKIKINGKLEEPVDANGKKVDIYAINGTTYLPVRFISTILDIPVEYYAYSNSVFIGKHMIQIDPNNYSNEYQKQAQDCLNYTEIIINQMKTDAQIMVGQHEKIVKKLVDPINNVILALGYDSACYKELEPIHNEVMIMYEVCMVAVEQFSTKYPDVFQNTCANLETTIDSVMTEEHLQPFLVLKADAELYGKLSENAKNGYLDSRINEFNNRITAVLNKYNVAVALKGNKVMIISLNNN